jgi:tetratricopeptide (TPR) repeat protein
MANYLVSGKDEHGRKVTEVVTAPTANEATRRFRDRGYSDVVLHSEEVLGHLFDPSSLGEHLTAADYLALGRLSRAGLLWHLTRKLYRQQGWLSLLALAAVVSRQVLGVPWGILDYLAILVLLLPLIVVLGNELFNPARRFRRALTYGAWARWAEMLDALQDFRRAGPNLELAFLEAKALSGMGRLDEALETVRPYAEDVKTPAWLYWDQLADVFGVARLPDRVIQCLERAAADAPDNPTVLLDLAKAYLRYRRDAVSARPLLERARQQEISDVLAPFVLLVEGMQTLEEGHPDRARAQLEQALDRTRRLWPSYPPAGEVIDRMHTYLCLACAGAGDPAAAVAHFRRAEPRLRAFAADDLLNRCRTALGE